MKPRSTSYQRGAADERAAILRKVKHVNKITTYNHAVDDILGLLIWIEDRVARYNKRKGGMQTRRGE